MLVSGYMLNIVCPDVSYAVPVGRKYKMLGLLFLPGSFVSFSSSFETLGQSLMVVYCVIRCSSYFVFFLHFHFLIFKQYFALQNLY